MSTNNSRSRLPSTITTNVDTDNVPQEAPRVLINNFVQDHEATENNLRQASTALEAAYRRIRHLRSSLLQIADSMPPTSMLARNLRRPNNIAPPHQSIVLPGGSSSIPTSSETVYDSTIPDFERLRSSLPSNVVDRLGRIESNNRRSARPDEIERTRLQDRLSQARPFTNSPTTAPTTRQPTLQTISPLTMDPIPPRRSWLEAQLNRRRESIANDPVTTLGHRVAAREAGAVRAAPTELWDEPAFLERTAQMLERLNNPNMRASEPSLASRPEVIPERSEARSLDNRLGLYRGSPPSNHQFFPRATPGRGFSRAMFSEMHSSGRLSTLSNLSVDNLRTPSTPDSRLVLFDEPYSYEPDNAFRSAELVHAVDRRSYQVRRTIDADGEELVHNINMGGWEEGELPWFPPGTEPALSDDNTTRQNTLGPRDTYWPDGPAYYPEQPEEGRSRRRAWARLNADGDDISFEEEELERVRRVRASRRDLLANDGASPPFVTVTRNVMNHVDDELNVARVRLSRYNPLPGMAEREPRRPTCVTRTQTHEPAVYGSPTPFAPNPLPMSLSDMVPSPHVHRRRLSSSEAKLRNSRTASLPLGLTRAGR